MKNYHASLHLQIKNHAWLEVNITSIHDFFRLRWLVFNLYTFADGFLVQVNAWIALLWFLVVLLLTDIVALSIFFWEYMSLKCHIEKLLQKKKILPFRQSRRRVFPIRNLRCDDVLMPADEMPFSFDSFSSGPVWMCLICELLWIQACQYTWWKCRQCRSIKKKFQGFYDFSKKLNQLDSLLRWILLGVVLL